MPPEPTDMARLWDMLDAAQAVVEFTKGLNFEQFLTDRRTLNAVERNLEVLGEAAKRVSAEVQDSHPEIAWRAVIGFRNVLAHDYGEVRYEIVWSVIQEKLPPLIRHLKMIGADKSPPA